MTAPSRGVPDDTRALIAQWEAALAAAPDMPVMQRVAGQRLAVALEAVRAENRTLRELLWSGHGHTGLYGDDGEMQCATCMIDYKRDSASEIERKRTTNGQRALMARRQEEGQTDNG